jgi:hypothetical protein
MAQQDKPISSTEAVNNQLVNVVIVRMAMSKDYDRATQALHILDGIAHELGVKDLGLIPETLAVLQGIYAARNGIPLDLADRALKILEAENRKVY